MPPDFARAISVRIVRSASSGWAEGTAACVAYRDVHGDLEPPRGWTTAEGLPLYSWLENQKTRYREDRTTPAEITELERLGILWNKHDHIWEQFLADLVTFRDEHGHLGVPQKYVAPSGRPLGTQVTTRRTTWDELGAERQAELLELGFIRDRLEHYWDQGFAAWLEFTREHGHPIVPYDHITASGLRLGHWRVGQLSKLRSGDLPPERAKRMKANQLDLNGSELHELRHLEALQEYRLAQGHTEVPTDHVTADGVKLGRWLCNQRKKLRNNTISPDLAREFSRLGVRAVLRKLPGRG
ncbi:helicase associated domain-containing protein [Streptomyces sp. NPDC005492]|uniref:helicase associated domain-containing protein n=1 Tax=Streptomyces sp. NPDC005492 TaxID=3156883 RepID=UPI0033BF47EC